MYLSRVSEETGLQAEERERVGGEARYGLRIHVLFLHVRELLVAKRLAAQVEGMLKDASGRPFPENDSPPEVDAEFVDLTGFQETGSAEQDVDFDLPDVSPNTGVEPGSHPPPGSFDFLPTGADRPPNAPFSWSDMPPAGPLPADGGNSANELLYLGLFEALPPYEMIEEL